MLSFGMKSAFGPLKRYADVPLGSEHLNSCGDSLRFYFTDTLSLGYSHICLQNQIEKIRVILKGLIGEDKN